MKLNIGMTIRLISVFMIISVFDAIAGPVIIRDNRVTDIGTTPVLGRGYTMSTNTFQSICLKDVKITEPSYDFNYRFEKTETSGNSEESKTTDADQVSSPEINQSFKKYLETIKTKKGNTVTRNGKTYETYYMKAIIDLDTYYASVDEANTSLSSSAKNLLTNNDIPGYFDSCGSYYVRSINRRASLVSVFSFEATSKESAEEFAGMIETQIKSFGEVVTKTESRTRAGWNWGGWGYNYNTQSNTTTQWVEDKSAAQTKANQLTEKFKSLAKESNLTITTAGFGLGKDKEATLVSYDIDSFKLAIKDAFKAMQNPLTGKVVSIEVVPWVENTEFQDLVKLNEIITIPATKDEKGTTVPEKVLQPYQMKHNINENAEFLAEIKKNDRNLLNIYYKAKMCKSHFDTNWRDEKGKLQPRFAASNLRNNRRPGSTIKTTELDAKLNDEYIEGLYAKEQDFMYTGQNAASKCMNAMIKNDIRTVHYRNINECTAVIKNMGNLQAEMVDDYCMPELK